MQEHDEPRNLSDDESYVEDRIGSAARTLRRLSEPMKVALAGVAAMPVKRETKLSVLISLLERPEGANLEDMIAATGWQKHTIRSALSHALAKKRGYQIVSEKTENAGWLSMYQVRQEWGGD